MVTKCAPIPPKNLEWLSPFYNRNVHKSQVSKPNPTKKKSKKELKAAAKKAAKGGDSDDEIPKEDDEDIEMPADNVLYKLVDRLEAQLPRDDHVKYDSRYEQNIKSFKFKSI